MDKNKIEIIANILRRIGETTMKQRRREREKKTNDENVSRARVDFDWDGRSAEGTILFPRILNQFIYLWYSSGAVYVVLVI